MKRVSISLRLAASTAFAALALVGLSACMSADPIPVNAVMEPATGSHAANASATPTPTASATLTGIPTGLTCGKVLSASALYSLKGGSNYALDPTLKPTAGSVAETMFGMNGLACTYVDETSGDAFTIAVAKPTPLARVAITPLVQNFSVVRGLGVAQTLTPTYWISVSSQSFEAPSDAAQILSLVTKALGGQ